MKKSLLTTALLFLISGLSYGQLIITGIYDGDGSAPKGIELYAITTGDYTGWEIKTQSNANTNWVVGYTMGDDAGDSGSYTAGDYIYISSDSTLSNWGWGIGGASEKGLYIFDSSFSQNGDDRIAVFNDSDVLIDIYGVDGEDGTGKAWEYLDSYSYRKDNVGASSSFNVANWTVAGVNALESADPDQQTVLTNVFGKFSYVESSDPAISSSSYSVSGFTYLEDNGPSSEQSFTLSGTNLDADISIAGTTNFEISTLSGASFSATNPITLSETGGEVAETSIYIRLKAGLTEATYNDTLVVTSTDADTVRIALEGTVIAPLSFPYTNAFGTTSDLEAAETLGFDIDYSAQTSYLRLAIDEYIETPTIDFTTMDGIHVSFDLTTFGGSNGQEFSTLVSDDDGATYDTLATYTVPASYTTYTTKIDLTGDYNVATGKIKLVMTGGTASTRLQNLSIKESYVFKLTGVEGWRFISSPVVGPMEDLLDPIWTQGIASGADVTTGDPNVFGWDNSTLDQDYSVISNLSGSFSAGLGYLVYVYADDNYDGSADAFPKTLSISGTENAVDASPSLIGGNNSYFYLVGNPFASTIDFDAVTKTDLTDVAYVWDPNSETGNEGKNGETASGSWKSWNGTTGDITDGLIAPFQGFFIQGETTGSPSPEITFGAASKSTGGTFLGKANTSTIAKARIKVSGANTANSMWVQFSEEGSATSHVKGDAVELQSLDDSFAELAAIKGGELFDIAHLPIAEEVSLPISFRTTEGGTYTFTASNFEIPSSFSIVFHDYETGKSMTVDENFSYEFEATAIKQKSVPVLKSLQQGPIVAKANTENRFGLVVTQKVASSNEIKELPSVFALDQNYPNPFNPTTTIKYSVAKAGEVHLSVYNMMGQKVTDLVSGTKQAGNYAISWNAEGMASGMYFYRLSSAGQTITRQMTLIK